MNSSQDKVKFDAVVFDCDGTLSKIEGIDELAEMNHVGDEVKSYTQTAMGGSGLTTEIYDKRLELCQPTKAQLDAVAEMYIKHKTKGIEELISVLKQQSISLYVISAGLLPAVKALAMNLGVDEEHAHAVGIFFNPDGRYKDFDHNSPMTRNDGKREVIKELKKKHTNIALIGDGKNDLACQDVVDRFIGFGGTYRHAAVEEAAHYYVSSESIFDCYKYLL